MSAIIFVVGHSTVLHFDSFFGHLFTNKVILDGDVLRLAMELRIFGHTNCRLIFLKECICFCWWSIGQLGNQLSHPWSFLNFSWQCNVLSFCCRESYAGLLLAPPAHRSTADLEHVPRCGLSVIKITSSLSFELFNIVSHAFWCEDQA